MTSREALHAKFRELGYTTNAQTTELLNLVFSQPPTFHPFYVDKSGTVEVKVDNGLVSIRFDSGTGKP